MGRVIALLGAESTGKTTLAHLLARQLMHELRAQGATAALVPEYLRLFCDAHARTPRMDEQAGIALEQTRRIEAAAATHDFVLADTTALMTAVYSDFIFDDTSLYASALAQHARADCTLVTGLDLPWEADGLQRDGEHVREPVDALVRRALESAALPYCVVYGIGDARTVHAMNAVRRALDLPLAAPEDASAPAPRWRARCSECLVPECEHLALLPKTA